MKLLIPITDLQNYKSRDKLIPIECEQCGETFFSDKRTVQTAISDTKRDRLRFCSKHCFRKSIDKKKSISCHQCGKTTVKKLSDIKKGKLTFCSQSCCATYYNTHKNTGYSRSKLEYWLESQLTSMYAELHFIWNSREILDGVELDIFIPEYKLAFELNGIFHYEPIFGNDQLKHVQDNDSRKFQRCIDKKISLCVIDTTSMKYFKEEKAKIFLEIIRGVINKHRG